MTDTFNSDWASCPGNTIKEFCKERNQLITDHDTFNLLFNHLDLNQVKFISLLNGLEPITEKIADLLAEIFEVTTPKFWLKLEEQFVSDLECIGISRALWVMENADFRLYKVSLTHEMYVISASSDCTLDSLDYSLQQLVKESISDSTDLGFIDVEVVKATKDLDKEWRGALPYVHDSLEEDPIINTNPELTCLQVLQCTGVNG
jgi:plasmid maintenance system antidote protein VapI